MLKIQKYSILLSFLGLWLTSYLTNESQTLLGLALIFSFGILHGANDLKLIDHIEKGKGIHFLKILGAYILLVLVSVVLFLQIPFFALLIFIVVSAYHFGEQNWQLFLKESNTITSGLLQFSYGLLILSALFYFNAEEVEKIIFKIASIRIKESQFQILLLISTLIYVVSCVLIVKERNVLISNVLEQSLFIIILIVIFKVASLILGFAIYFILWHSIPSLYDQIKFLYGTYNFSNFKKYFKAAFWYWLISLLGVSVLYYISKDMLFFDALFFSFLASITFPHFIVIVVMFQRKKNDRYNL
jgi:Brp/Blh family beta-carotene 15,15'-monooxygenase